ncbi:protein ABHD1-like [Halichondria panicea]|uniref:protein ABHD1-like n=1 Tax=Halichondria panicea TaxID=6063 RepID=UPI00312BAED2
MDDYYSLPVLYSLGLNAHLGFLCRLINETIISPTLTSDLLPIQSDHFKNIELTCDDVVPVLEVCIPWLCLFTISLSLLLLYSAYYQYVMVKKPKVVCHDPGRMAALKKHCPVFFEKYRLTPWAPNAYMQSIIRVAIQTFPKEERRRETVTMKSDDGHVCLDWFNEKTDEQPTVLMLPGITGSSNENYVRHWINDMKGLGYRAVVFNYRGCGYTKLSTPRTYVGSDISDLTDVISHITTKLPKAPLLAVGASMGTMQLLKYVAVCKRQGKTCPLKALFLISTVWDPMETNKVIHSPLNKYTLNRHLCNNFKDVLRENRAVFEESSQKGELCFDYNKALQCTDFRQFTEVLVFPMFGYKNFQDLFSACSPTALISDFTIPILSLNADDDPFTPEYVIPEEGARSNPNLILVTTRRGGHIGFMEGLLPTNKNLMDRALIQFIRAVFEHDAFV